MSGLTFKPNLAAKVMGGDKTKTRRAVNTEKRRSPWWTGRESWPESWAVCPGRGKDQIGRVRVVRAHKERLGSVFGDTLGVDDQPPGALNEARAEGFRDVGAFKLAWIAINGTWDPDLIVWCIELEVISDPSGG